MPARRWNEGSLEAQRADRSPEAPTDDRGCRRDIRSTVGSNSRQRRCRGTVRQKKQDFFVRCRSRFRSAISPGSQPERDLVLTCSPTPSIPRRSLPGRSSFPAPRLIAAGTRPSRSHIACRCRVSDACCRCPHPRMHARCRSCPLAPMVRRSHAPSRHCRALQGRRHGAVLAMVTGLPNRTVNRSLRLSKISSDSSVCVVARRIGRLLFRLPSARCLNCLSNLIRIFRA